jgi:hypothetical protein
MTCKGSFQIRLDSLGTVICSTHYLHIGADKLLRKLRQRGALEAQSIVLLELVKLAALPAIEVGASGTR